MYTIYEQYLDRLCRTCMYELTEMVATKENREWKSIFDTVTGFGELSIAELLSKTWPQIEVHLDDDLPKKICSECTVQLLNAYRFHQICLQSEQRIRELLDKKQTALELTMEEGSREEEICTNELPINGSALGTEQSINSESALQPNTVTATDPLQVVPDGYGYLTVPKIDTTHILKSEPSDGDKANIEYSEQEEFVAMLDVKIELNIGEEPIGLPSFEGSMETKESTFYCEVCGKQFFKLYNLKRHKQELHFPGSINYTCCRCNKSFEESRQYKNHLWLHRRQDELNGNSKKPEKRRYECELCDMKFGRIYNLNRHKKTVHSSDSTTRRNFKNKPPVEKRFGCELCGMAFSTRFIIMRHIKARHFDYDPIQNSQSNNTSPKYPIMLLPPQPQEHREQEHQEENEESNLHHCDICDKGFKYSSQVSEHRRTHTGERPYLCPECGKSFNTKGILSQHRLRHIDAKQLECPYCPNKFRCSSDLAKHRAIHIGIKRHVCDVCGKAFIKPYQLRKHKKCHTDERPHKCEYCEMSFISANHQRRHMRTHTGEKPYKCKYCERSFAQSNDMIKHLRIHLGENVYRCEFCPSAHRLLSEVRLHQVTHKNEDSETRERNLMALKEAEAALQIELTKNGNSVENTSFG